MKNRTILSIYPWARVIVHVTANVSPVDIVIAGKVCLANMFPPATDLSKSPASTIVRGPETVNELVDDIDTAGPTPAVFVEITGL